MDPKPELERLLSTLAETADHEIDCDRFLDRAAAYVETIKADPSQVAQFAEMAQHLKVCAECREEFEALMDLYG